PVRNPCTVLAASIFCDRSACSTLRLRILSVALKPGLAPKSASASASSEPSKASMLKGRAYKDSRLYARPFNIDAFEGSLEADADADFGASPGFNATLKMRNLNVEQALRSQNIDAANTVHGFLTG